MKIKTIYIDDEDKELRKYERIFESDERAKNQFEIIAMNSQKQIGDLINEVKKKKPELILVDLDLTIPKEGLLLGVSGAALSIALREEFPEVPIVLFTKIDFLKIQKFTPKILSGLDEAIYKTDILKGDGKNLDILHKLAIGYKELRDTKSKTWMDLLKIIGAPENDYDFLKLAEPPTISKKYLFNWDEIPGNDTGRLIAYIAQKFGIDWVEKSKIDKIDNDMTIKLTDKENIISLKINNEQAKVNIEINDSRTDEFIVLMENGRQNIYSESGWSVFDAANWIRNTLIKYPGILYDPIHAATFLGISENAFLSKSVQELFDEARYYKLFAPIEGRWWKSRLLEIAESIREGTEKDLIVREGFPLAWNRINKTKIERSKCIFCGKEPADWVCYILKKPVMIKCSLRYKPDSRPSIMDEARVSFKAIRTSNEVNDDKFDPVEYDMLPKIRKM